MKITQDDTQFDAFQAHLVYEIIGAVRHELELAGISKTKLKDTATSVAFQVCSVLDGVHEMKTGKQRVRPVLTFALDQDRTDLVACDGGSSMHESVYGAADDHFDNTGPKTVIGGGKKK